MRERMLEIQGVRTPSPILQKRGERKGETDAPK